MLKFLFLFLFLASYSSAQSIRFVETDLESAISMAKSQNKGLFIDTYARYCQPCKILAKEFENPELADYFNDNFLNVRVNMDRSTAKAYELKYQIVFLPTLIFADEQGELEMKIDNLISARELLYTGMHLNGKRAKSVTSNITPTVTKPKAITKPQASELISDPQMDSEINADDIEGNILYVMGQDSDNLPPELLREEAYFRMQLMDGSHHLAAAKYLSSQSDWHRSENIKFIHDFLHDARSKEFQFLIDNKNLFNEIIGKERVMQTVNILVNKELERGYPRPNLERAIALMQYIEKEQPARLAMIYQLQNLYREENINEFIKLGRSIDLAELEDADLLYKFSSEQSSLTNSSKELRECYQLAKEAVTLDPSIAIYHYNQAQVALLLKDKKAAKNAATKALGLVANSEEAAEKIKQLLELIALL